MEVAELASALQQTEVLRRLLGSHQGAYSPGVARDPDRPPALAIMLHVEGAAPEYIPDHIQIGDESIRVIVKPGFVAPQPL